LFRFQKKKKMKKKNKKQKILPGPPAGEATPTGWIRSATGGS
jgi:hypothetical protein